MLTAIKIEKAPSLHIGLIGHKGSGKNLAAKLLRETIEFEFNPNCIRLQFEEVAFAAPLKQIAMILFGIPEEYLHDQEMKETPLPIYPFQSPRQILQTLGTESVRGYWPKAWIEAWKRNVAGRCLTITTDVRFQNEADAIWEKEGGYLIRIERPDADKAAKSDLHSSETVLEKIIPDRVIYNNGSAELLRHRIAVAVLELMEGALTV